jgi:hypothetical protein
MISLDTCIWTFKYHAWIIIEYITYVWTRMRFATRSRSRLSAKFHRLSSTLNWFRFWWELMSVFATRAVISSQLSYHSRSRLTGAWELRKLSLANFHYQLFRTLMQLLRSLENVRPIGRGLLLHLRPTQTGRDSATRREFSVFKNK